MNAQQRITPREFIGVSVVGTVAIVALVIFVVVVLSLWAAGAFAP